MSIGINIWPLSPPATTPGTFVMKKTMEAMELASVDTMAELDPLSVKRLFAKAAHYQLRGKTDSANALVLVGLDTAGLKQPELQIVEETLDTRAKAGNEVQRYKDVLTYLNSNEPASLATKAYRVDFIDRIAEPSTVFQSSTGGQSPNIKIKDGDVNINFGD